MLIGFATVAWYFYIDHPELPAEAWPRARGPLYLFLYNKWYFDEIYDVLFVRSGEVRLGYFLWKQVGDGKVIDGMGPDGDFRRHRRTGRSQDRAPAELATSIIMPSQC